MESFRVGADMGSVKVYTDDVSLFIHNGFGDGLHELQILTNPTVAQIKKVRKQYDPEGHFTVKKKGTVHVSDFDCTEGSPVYTFETTGRYFCYSKLGKVVIIRIDGDLHA